MRNCVHGPLGPLGSFEILNDFDKRIVHKTNRKTHQVLPKFQGGKIWKINISFSLNLQWENGKPSVCNGFTNKGLVRPCKTFDPTDFGPV